MSHPSTGDELLTGAARWIDRRDAEILLADCWGLTRSQLLARGGETVPAGVTAAFVALSSVSTLAFGALLAALAVRLYRREAILG